MAGGASLTRPTKPLQTSQYAKPQIIQRQQHQIRRNRQRRRAASPPSQALSLSPSPPQLATPDTAAAVWNTPAPDHDHRQQREAGRVREALRQRGVQRRNAIGGHNEVERRGDPRQRQKLVNGRSASSGMIWSNPSPTVEPIPVCVTVMASPSIPAT